MQVRTAIYLFITALLLAGTAGGRAAGYAKDGQIIPPTFANIKVQKVRIQQVYERQTPLPDLVPLGSDHMEPIHARVPRVPTSSSGYRLGYSTVTSDGAYYGRGDYQTRAHRHW